MDLDKLYDTDGTSRTIEMKGVVVATTNRALDSEANPRQDKPDANPEQIQIKIFSTYRDYEKDPTYREADILVDRRSNAEYFKKFLTNENIFFATFVKTSLSRPFWMRICYLMLNISILFTINALMFSDEDIEARIRVSESVRNTFAYELTYETSRTLVSITVTGVLIWILMWIFNPSKQVMENYDNELNYANRNMDQLIKAYDNLHLSMRMKYIVFIIITSIINLFGFYYVVCFSGVYIQTAVGWVYGCFWGLIIEFMILSLIYPLFLIAIRSLMRSCKFDFLGIFLRRY
jgi:hypothetical protein